MQETTTNKDGKTIHPPSPAFRDLVAELEAKLGRRPTLKEIAAAWRATEGRSTT